MAKLQAHVPGSRKGELQVPIVQITLFEGRDEETKARLAREVADVIAEATGNSIADVHVIFDEKAKNAWSRGLTLASRRTGARPTPARAEHATISRIQYDPNREAAYLALRRDVINPGMATQDGFVSSLLLRRHDAANEYLLINKWLTREHADAYQAGAVHDKLREQALSILPKPLETSGSDVVHLDPD
jgi:4-oxalocrotonate tautomerase family enzyme